tara:strand:- start:848 stop:2119 length:1272 start_codon:yes stop_codon:yes gene_type:complete
VKNKINLENAIKKCWDDNPSNQFNANDPIVRLHEPTFNADEIIAFTNQMLTTKVTMGEKVIEFEKKYCKKYSYKHGVSNNSGSSANLLMLSVLTSKLTENNLKKGDEIILPALTWSTTVWPVIQMGLIPVYVDCDLNTFNIDTNKIEEAISKKTKAIFSVPIYGNPCEMDDILSICKKHNLMLIEDCCESMGAKYKNKYVGSFGRVASFSFYYSHHITTLEGGICVTNDHDLSEMMRIVRAHGWIRQVENREKWTNLYKNFDPKFLFVNDGYNLRITEPQAAMGMLQIDKIDNFIKSRQDNAKKYYNKLKNLGDFFSFQSTTKDAENSHFGFPLILKNNSYFNRNEICSYLNKNGIETRPIIAGNLARQPANDLFEHRVSGDLSNSDHIMDNGFSVGVHQSLSDDAINYVVDNIKKFISKRKE